MGRCIMGVENFLKEVIFNLWFEGWEGVYKVEDKIEVRKGLLRDEIRDMVRVKWWRVLEGFMWGLNFFLRVMRNLRRVFVRKVI